MACGAMAAQSAVNRWVEGSNPSTPAMYNSIMNNVITTETISDGGGGIKNPDHSDGKIKIGKSPLRRKGSKK